MSTGSKIFLGVVAAIPLSIFWSLWEMNIIQTMWNCDSTDYSPIIKKVAVPMQQELEDFCTKNKRFPNTQERDEMLEKVGCEMEGNVCVYAGERITIIAYDTTNYQYKLKLRIENTGCYFGIQNSGNHTSVSCATRACLSLKQ